MEVDISVINGGGELLWLSSSASVNAEYNEDMDEEDDINVGTGGLKFRDNPAKSFALFSELDIPLIGVLGLEPPMLSWRAWNDSS
jgi:hypothetical protein